MKKNLSSSNSNTPLQELLESVASSIACEIETIVSQKTDEEMKTDFEKSILARWYKAENKRLLRPASPNEHIDWMTKGEFIGFTAREAVWPLALSATELAIGKELNGQAITDGLINEKKGDIYNHALEMTILYIEQPKNKPVTIIDKLKKTLGVNQGVPKLRQPK